MTTRLTRATIAGLRAVEGTMTWDAVGALAETVGAVAVLATLIYLPAQVRAAQFAGHARRPNRVAASAPCAR